MEDDSPKARLMALIDRVRAEALGLMQAAQQEMLQAYVRHAIRHLDRAVMCLNAVYSSDAAVAADNEISLAKRALDRVSTALAKSGPDATTMG